MTADAEKPTSSRERGAVWRGLLVVVMFFLLLLSLRHQMLEAEVRRAQVRLSECGDAACAAEASAALEQTVATCESLLAGVGLPLRALGRKCRAD